MMKDCIQSNADPDIPLEMDSGSNRIEWSTLSNAALTSVEWCLLNPDWNSGRRQFLHSFNDAHGTGCWFCSVCRLTRIVKLAVVSIEIYSKTERFHMLLDVGCVEEVRDRARSRFLRNTRSQQSTPRNQTAIMNRRTDDEGLYPVKRRSRYSIGNGQRIQQDQMIHIVKRGTNVCRMMPSKSRLKFRKKAVSSKVLWHLTNDDSLLHELQYEG